jgi:hypothetical protein
VLTNRLAKVHHNKVPLIGAIVEAHVDRELQPGHRWRQFRVVSYPGFPLRLLPYTPYANGHLVNLEALDNGWKVRVACHYLEDISWAYDTRFGWDAQRAGKRRRHDPRLHRNRVLTVR